MREGVPFRALPDETRLDMPVQSLRTRPPRNGRPLSQPRTVFLRRAYILCGTALLTALGAREI